MITTKLAQLNRIYLWLDSESKIEMKVMRKELHVALTAGKTTINTSSNKRLHPLSYLESYKSPQSHPSHNNTS